MFGKESARLFLPAIGSALLFQLPSSCLQNPQLASGFADFAVNVLEQSFHFAALAGFPDIYPLPKPVLHYSIM